MIITRAIQDKGEMDRACSSDRGQGRRLDDMVTRAFKQGLRDSSELERADGRICVAVCILDCALHITAFVLLNLGTLLLHSAQKPTATSSACIPFFPLSSTPTSSIRQSPQRKHLNRSSLTCACKRLLSSQSL